MWIHNCSIYLLENWFALPLQLNNKHSPSLSVHVNEKGVKKIKQEAHGPHRSPEKPVQINLFNTFERSYDYIYYKIGPIVQEKIFKFRECTFAILLLSSNEKRFGLSIWTNLNPVYQRMLFAKFGWNWPNGSRGEDFLKLSMYFYYFVIISPWKRGALHLNKL